MKTITTLIKIHQQQLDLLRRNLGGLELQKVQLIELDRNLEKELAGEIKLAEQNSELAGYFGDYIKRVRQRQERLRAEVAGIEEQMVILREAVHFEYGEQLKFEKILEQRLEAKRKAAAIKEGLELDEIAGQQHRRKEES